MIACEQTGNTVADHFTGTGKMVKLGSKAEREVTDYFLSRFACYLIAQNGDPRKPEIAAAQVYFAVSTRAFEMHQLRKEPEDLPTAPSIRALLDEKNRKRKKLKSPASPDE